MPVEDTPESSIELEESARLEERADYIDSADLASWNVENEFFRNIQKQLVGKGPKLLVGPRGCGKTHQIRFAHARCLKDSSKPFSVYVSFGQYLWLEPRLTESANAIHVFHTWVLAKLLIGVSESAEELETDVASLFEPRELKRYVSEIEKGLVQEWHEKVEVVLTISAVCDHIEEAASRCGRNRTVLFLDDAALSLTPEYMVEFFEVFRSLKRASISPKASVYPGTTQYGPRFHVGHDAVPVNCWLSIDDDSSGRFMGQILSSRLAGKVPEGVGQLFKYAAFGIPRILISLGRSYSLAGGKTAQQKFNFAIQERSSQIEAEYRSLALKLPQYKTIIDAGWQLFQKCVEELSNVNKALDGERQLLIGIEHADDVMLEKLMKLLCEVGLFYDKQSVRHGGRDYDRYIPHLIFLVKERVFERNRGFMPEVVAARIESEKSPKHPVRRKFSTLLGDLMKSLRLDVPACGSCGAARLSEGQRFCHNCGSRLVRVSTFEACMKTPIEKLGLPSYQEQGLLNHTAIQTVRDIAMLNDPATEIRKVRMVGPVRTDKIVKATQRFIKEYLER